jgi:hypothetical protein
MRRIIAAVLLIGSLSGCGVFNLGPWGGPAYEMDTDKLGTGQQTIVPRTDATYYNGEQMSRTHR